MKTYTNPVYPYRRPPELEPYSEAARGRHRADAAATRRIGSGGR